MIYQEYDLDMSGIISSRWSIISTSNNSKANELIDERKKFACKNNAL